MYSFFMPPFQSLDTSLHDAHEMRSLFTPSSYAATLERKGCYAVIGGETTRHSYIVTIRARVSIRRASHGRGVSPYSRSLRNVSSGERLNRLRVPNKCDFAAVRETFGLALADLVVSNYGVRWPPGTYGTRTSRLPCRAALRISDPVLSFEAWVLPST